MQAVILAAGLGTRMGKLTKNTPKPMLKIGDKNLLELKIEALPSQVDEVVLIIGYKGEVIKKYFKDNFAGKKITYVKDKELKGTAKALWQARKILKNKFLVMMGDDLYDKKAIMDCIKKSPSICCKVAKPEEPGDRVLLKNKKLSAFISNAKNLELKKPSELAFTGMYCLTKDIFRYKPVKLKTKDEYGLPQTLLKMATNKKINIVKTDFWLQISTPEDLKIAENILKNKNRAE